MPLPQTPPMVRMGDGTYRPAQVGFVTKPTHPRKLLVVLQYYEGDKAAAEELSSLIADLERIRNHEADIVVFGRFDATDFSRSVVTKLESKFDRVHLVKCRRKDATHYPFSANAMFYDLVTLFGQFRPWSDDYYAFLNLESDCVPVHPGWISQLIEEFRNADARGFGCVGHVQMDHYVPHMNGVAVYAIDIWKRVPGGKLSGGNPQIAYDMFQAKNLLPLAVDTPYIVLDFQRPTISSEDLFRANKNGVEPAIYHGVKDSSARIAVRAQHVSFSERRDMSRESVFTYYDPITLPAPPDHQQILRLWADGWSSRGWNPIVLRKLDAYRKGNCRAMMEAIEKLPYVGNKEVQRQRFLRWAALDALGGGLLVDWDMLPTNFDPSKLDAGSRMTREIIDSFIKAVIAYDPQPEDQLAGKPHVTDTTVLLASFPGFKVLQPFSVANFGAEKWREAQVIHFSQEAVNSSPLRGMAKSVAMERYLRGL